MSDNPYRDDPRLRAPAGPTGAAEKGAALSGPGGTSPEDQATERRAAEEAGGVLPADDEERLRETGVGSGPS